MATEREEALRSIQAQEEKPPASMVTVLTDAEQTRQLAITHEHRLKMRQAELGWFGRVFGGEAHAAIVIAFMVIVFGFITAIVLWAVAYLSGQHEFWATEAHLPLAAATSALGFVFGRGSKEPREK